MIEFTLASKKGKQFLKNLAVILYRYQVDGDKDALNLLKRL